MELDPAKVLRCTQCKACFYCSEKCQKRNWKRIHKRVCSTDVALRPFIRMEMAIERTIAKQPPMEQAPPDARCYICLDGDDSGKLMRGCACRGDSAGFVHFDCLAQLAESKESGERKHVFNAWNQCGNCLQGTEGILGVKMKGRFWRRHRSRPDLQLRFLSKRSLATCLWSHDEIEQADQLLDEALFCVGNQQTYLDIRLLRATMQIKKGNNVGGLGMLQAMLPEAKAYVKDPYFHSQVMLHIAEVLFDLKRYRESRQFATDTVTFSTAKYGKENPFTLRSRAQYAAACALLGRVDEARTIFNDVLTIESRVLGRDHPRTEDTRRCMRAYLPASD